MRLKTIAKGLMVGSAIGATYYVFTGTTPKQRKHMKKNLCKTIRKIGCMCNDFSYMM
ncbi:MAG: hypothetical protein ACI4WH_05340 [Oscillospiraceae bacterium]